MKKALFLPLLLFTQVLFAQNISDIEGSWKGTIEITGQTLAIEILFGYDDGELDGTINIPQQNAYNLPVEVTEATGDSIVFQFQTGTGVAVFNGNRNPQGDLIEGDFEQVGVQFPFTISKESSSNGLNGAFPDDEIIIPTRAGQISGSLLLQDEPAPLVYCFPDQALRTETKMWPVSEFFRNFLQHFMTMVILYSDTMIAE